jgi:gliding motility associated protien GldN
MRKLIPVLIVAAFMFVANSAYAQPRRNVLDGAYVPENNPQRRVKEWPYLREADVLWKKRVWEEIDLRQKMNYPLLYPLKELKGRKSLWQVILKGIEDGNLTAYSTGPDGADDEFTFKLEPEQVKGYLSFTKTEKVEVAQDVYDTTTVTIQRPQDDIVGYRLKEDWIFDKQRSQRYVRIIGIAPIAKVRNSEGDERDPDNPMYAPLFWLYYRECRYVFANWDSFNSVNDAFRGSYDDLFEMRRFSAHVIKEENVYDREIQEYAQGLDALLESERVKKEIFEYEHDLWNY